MRATLLLLLAFIALASSITTEEREAKKMTIRMKSKHALTYTAARLFSHVRRSTLAASRQLKEIFEEMGYPYKHMPKEEMQKVRKSEEQLLHSFFGNCMLLETGWWSYKWCH